MTDKFELALATFDRAHEHGATALVVESKWPTIRAGIQERDAEIERLRGDRFNAQGINIDDYLKLADEHEKLKVKHSNLHSHYAALEKKLSLLHTPSEATGE